MNSKKSERVPLAHLVRPRRLEDFAGQRHLVGEGKLLYRLIKADMLSSAIFYGPPGTGKTTLASIIAAESSFPFRQLSAVSAGVKEIRQVAEEAANPILNPGGRVLLFFDEIHRLNKGQQDVLLPYVENGTIVLIGATTENPYFEINKALISRSTVFQFYPLAEEDILLLIGRALNAIGNAYNGHTVELRTEAAKHIARVSDGDARRALNALELALKTTAPDSEGRIIIGLETAENSIQQRALRYDKSGDQHYDVISAFIKSMRGSDPQAVLHYLARMLHAGEDINFIARRIIIAAAEDVGLANPRALEVAVAAAEAVRMIGMPEARIILAEAALMVALSPKSNSAYLGIDRALEDVKSGRIGEVPLHLRDASYPGASVLGHGRGYKYPHDYPGHHVKQQYLPSELEGAKYYTPTRQGAEKI
ncbi:MAG TPA: replication-associated recombination protein A [Bacillota bacterium]|nr:replication-associated recombination protein A [Bacillota bacterium]HQD41126.1 replication-associated recombination protein A [Bacillota bacterium]